MRTAACIQIMNGYDKNYIMNTYKNLIRQNYDQLDPLPLSLLKQVNLKTVNSINKADTLARGFKVFDPSNRNKVRVQINDGVTAEARTAVKDTIIRLL